VEAALVGDAYRLREEGDQLPSGKLRLQRIGVRMVGGQPAMRQETVERTGPGFADEPLTNILEPVEKPLCQQDGEWQPVCALQLDA
jgi:hypothetical protein